MALSEFHNYTMIKNTIDTTNVKKHIYNWDSDNYKTFTTNTSYKHFR